MYSSSASQTILQKVFASLISEIDSHITEAMFCAMTYIGSDKGDPRSASLSRIGLIAGRNRPREPIPYLPARAARSTTFDPNAPRGPSSRNGLVGISEPMTFHSSGGFLSKLVRANRGKCFALWTRSSRPLRNSRDRSVRDPAAVRPVSAVNGDPRQRPADAGRNRRLATLDPDRNSLSERGEAFKCWTYRYPRRFIFRG